MKTNGGNRLTRTQPVPETGAFRRGHPLSFSRAGAADLTPWIARVNASEVLLPPGTTLTCGMLNDTMCVRVLIAGAWSIDGADGLRHYNQRDQRQSLMFGPHSRRMPITVQGDIRVITAQLRPGASAVLGGPAMPGMVDRVIDYDDLVGHGHLGSRFDPQADGSAWIAAFEAELRTLIARNAVAQPHPVTQAFEAASFASPEMTVGGFAAMRGLSVRTLERIVLRDFGMTPKQVLRRARALDMAALLLGVASVDEAATMHLRYFDQSHLIREIQHFFGMTPSQLQHRANPLLRLNLETRQDRRLEALQQMPPEYRAG